jgi:S-DNA-T family DNA segregation ATPase FtsK/SpoIIIE
MGVYFGLTTGMWHMVFMAGFTALVAIVLRLRLVTTKEFRLELRSRGVFVNGRRVSNWIRLWPKPWREEYSRQFEAILAGASQKLTKTNFERLSFVVGFGCELNLETQGPHLFLVGPTGSGKSRLLQLILSSISGDIILRLADYKGGATLAKFGDCVTDLSPDDVREAFWAGLLDLLREREHYLVLHNVSRVSETGLPSVLVVVDELAHAVRQDRSALATLSSIAARGRSLGVHLICASQSVSGVPRELLVNLNLRMVLAGTDEVDALQLGAKAKPVRLPGVGSGLVVGGFEFRFPFRQEPIQVNQQLAREPKPLVR